MNILIIRNEDAGTKKNEDIFKKILKEFDKRGITYNIDRTISESYLYEKFRDIKEINYDCICIAGGDGTIHHTINATLHLDKKYIIVPLGSGNDYYHSLYEKFDFDKFLERLDNFKFKKVDLLKVADIYSPNVTGLGIDVETLIHRKKFKKIMWGKFPYKFAALQAFITNKAQKLKVEIDGATIEGKFPLVVFANGAYFGGHMEISPYSKVDDGIVECIILKDVPKRELVGLLKKMMRAEHLEDERVIFLRGKNINVIFENTIEIECEGEIHRVSSFEVEVLKERIEVLV